MCDDNTDNDAGGAGIVCGLEDDGGPDDSGLEVLVEIVPVVVVVPTSGVVAFPFNRLSSAKITTRFTFISDKQVLIMAMF